MFGITVELSTVGSISLNVCFGIIIILLEWYLRHCRDFMELMFNNKLNDGSVCDTQSPGNLEDLKLFNHCLMKIGQIKSQHKYFKLLHYYNPWLLQKKKT